MFSDVTGKKPWLGYFTPNPDGLTIMLLVRFAPGEGQKHCTEWQIDTNGETTLYFDIPPNAKGQHSIAWAEWPAETKTTSDASKMARCMIPKPPVGLMTSDLSAYATSHCHELIGAFTAVGKKVVAVGRYHGSFGPSHFLRDGVIYHRK